MAPNAPDLRPVTNATWLLRPHARPPARVYAPTIMEASRRYALLDFVRSRTRFHLPPNHSV